MPITVSFTLLSVVGKVFLSTSTPFCFSNTSAAFENILKTQEVEHKEPNIREIRHNLQQFFRAVTELKGR